MCRILPIGSRRQVLTAPGLYHQERSPFPWIFPTGTWE